MDTSMDTKELESQKAQDREQMTLDELADQFESRGTTYGLLSRLYNTEVDEALYQELLEMHYPVESGNEQMNEGFYHIAKYLSNEWVDPLTKLAIDYSATFLGGGIDAYSAAYPFESVYTSEKRLLMQDARDEVLAIYRANGLDKSEDWKVGEDHIAVELEFMRLLVSRTIRTLRGNNEERALTLIATQRNFLADHISVWVPVFTADIRRFSKTMFYQGLAELTDGFIESETELLDSLIVEDEDAEGEAAQADEAPAEEPGEEPGVLEADAPADGD